MTQIRPYRPEDAEAVTAVIDRALREVNIRDYSPDAIQGMVDYYSPRQVQAIAEIGHMYVACREAAVVGVGALKPMEAPGEYEISTVFIRPDCAGQGIGKAIVETLEGDRLFLAARRIFVSASLSAPLFYEKLGYTYENGDSRIFDNDNYHMEKHPNP